MHEHSVYETAHEANIARLRQLAEDAQAKADETKGIGTEVKQHAYWLGMKDGLTRSIGVLEGRG